MALLSEAIIGIGLLGLVTLALLSTQGSLLKALTDLSAALSRGSEDHSWREEELSGAHCLRQQHTSASVLSCQKQTSDGSASFAAIVDE